MSSSSRLLGVESCDFPHAKKEPTACKAKEFHTMTTIFTKNSPRLSFCEISKLCKQLFSSHIRTKS